MNTTICKNKINALSSLKSPVASLKSSAGMVIAVLLLVSTARCQETSTDSTKGNDGDIIKQLQTEAVTSNNSPLGYWGTDPEKYCGWKNHSNRLIPVYTFGTKGAGKGIDLNSYRGKNSVYRSEDALRKIYGFLPENTVDPKAKFMDQTNIADIQTAAAAAGKKHIFLVVFDGMDWQTTQAAAIYNSGQVYTKGKGAGTHFQDYTAEGTAQFSFMVTSPHNQGSDGDADSQTVKNPGGTIRGGYNAEAAGATPWTKPADPEYLIAKPAKGSPDHAYTDSSSSASSMTAALKTYNGGINVDANGAPVTTIAHRLQEQGFAVGAVSSVPISHATPAAAYAHNVTRQDYQDLTRDMIGLPSIQHPNHPLPGMDVVIGGGFGTEKPTGKDQGANYVAGNIYMTDADLMAVDIKNGGKYVTAVRTAGENGAQVLASAAAWAKTGNHRLLGFFGLGQYNGHLPFQTADGNYDPAPGVGKTAEVYSAADINENPTLQQMTEAAIQVLAAKQSKGFWLMVEAGDVDWANHDDNIDCSIGAVNSGDKAVKSITDWVEQNSNWQESLLIVTADHGHMWNLLDPSLLAKAASASNKENK